MAYDAGKLVLFDSRDRLQGGRKVTVFPLTYAGFNQAWDMVVTDEVSESERDGYAFMRIDPKEAAVLPAWRQGIYVVDVMLEAFNEYWAEYGWYLTTMPEHKVADLSCSEKFYVA